MSLKLGDKVEKVIKAVVPESIIKKVKEKEGGCGCSERQSWLNELI